MLKKT